MVCSQLGEGGCSAGLSHDEKEDATAEAYLSGGFGIARTSIERLIQV